MMETTDIRGNLRGIWIHCLPLSTVNFAPKLADSEVTRRVTVKTVKRRRKKNSPSALARSKRRLERFLEKKSAGKPDLASPGETGTPVSPQQDSVILQDSLTCGNVRDLTFSDQPTSVENPQAELRPIFKRKKRKSY